MALHNGADRYQNGVNGKAEPLRFDHFEQHIDGAAVPTDKQRNGINPATQKPLWPVPLSDAKHLDLAVDAAKHAQQQWKNVPFKQRRDVVLAYSDAVEKYKEDFTKLLTTENGKPLWQASIEATYTIDWIRGMAQFEIPEETIEDTETRKIIVRYTPIGVVGAIVPWNFPLMLAAAKIAPAVLMGNVVIVKPSPFAPYCGLKLVELAQRFFPPGVVQSISGGDDIGPMLTSHLGVDKISFTGSTVTGKAVMKSCAGTLKRVVLELGGNDPAIICPDVDISKVAPKVALFAFLNTGQICLNMKRIYIHKDIKDDFLRAMTEHLQNMTVGDGLKEGIMLGPLQNGMQYERAQSYFDDIPKEKWKVVCGGEGPKKDGKGYFVNPTIIDDPPEKSRIVVEEPFGPIVPALAWEDEDDVIARANDTRMGLGASVWSKDLVRAERIAKQIDAGSVWINNHFDLSPLAPFGGHKESGISCEWGLNGLKAMCNVQSLFYNKNVDDV